MAESEVGYERFFFDWYGGVQREARAREGAAREHYAGPRWDALRRVLELYDPVVDTLPAYFAGDAPCTVLIDEIEALWSAIAERDDWKPFEDKIAAIRAFGAALNLRAATTSP